MKLTATAPRRPRRDRVPGELGTHRGPAGLDPLPLERSGAGSAHAVGRRDVRPTTSAPSDPPHLPTSVVRRWRRALARRRRAIDRQPPARWSALVRRLNRCSRVSQGVAETGVDVEHERVVATRCTRPGVDLAGRLQDERPGRVAAGEGDDVLADWPWRKRRRPGPRDRDDVAVGWTTRWSCGRALLRPRWRSCGGAAGTAASSAAALLWHSRSSCVGDRVGHDAGAGLHATRVRRARRTSCGWRWRCRGCRRSRRSRRRRRTGPA